VEKVFEDRSWVKKIRQKYSKDPKEGVSIIVVTNKLQCKDNIFSNYRRLKYPCMELIIILNDNKLKIESYKIKFWRLNNVRVFQLDESCTLGECLNFGIEQSKYDYISKMDDDDYYGVNYFTDLMNVFKYTDTQVTGKFSRFIYFKESSLLAIFSPHFENKYVPGVAGGTITFKKEIFNKIKFRCLYGAGTDISFFEDCSNIGIKIFSADKYNYVYVRNKNLDEHTWKIGDEEIMESYCEKVINTKYYIPFIIA
jgi:hypothetical protein